MSSEIIIDLTEQRNVLEAKRQRFSQQEIEHLQTIQELLIKQADLQEQIHAIDNMILERKRVEAGNNPYSKYPYKFFCRSQEK